METEDQSQNDALPQFVSPQDLLLLHKSTATVLNLVPSHTALPDSDQEHSTTPGISEHISLQHMCAASVAMTPKSPTQPVVIVKQEVVETPKELPGLLFSAETISPPLGDMPAAMTPKLQKLPVTVIKHEVVETRPETPVIPIERSRSLHSTELISPRCSEAFSAMVLKSPVLPVAVITQEEVEVRPEPSVIATGHSGWPLSTETVSPHLCDAPTMMEPKSQTPPGAIVKQEMVETGIGISVTAGGASAFKLSKDVSHDTLSRKPSVTTATEKVPELQIPCLTNPRKSSEAKPVAKPTSAFTTENGSHHLQGSGDNPPKLPSSPLKITSLTSAVTEIGTVGHGTLPSFDSKSFTRPDDDEVQFIFAAPRRKKKRKKVIESQILQHSKNSIGLDCDTGCPTLPAPQLQSVRAPLEASASPILVNAVKKPQPEQSHPVAPPKIKPLKIDSLPKKAATKRKYVAQHQPSIQTQERMSTAEKTPERVPTLKTAQKPVQKTALNQMRSSATNSKYPPQHLNGTPESMKRKSQTWAKSETPWDSGQSMMRNVLPQPGNSAQPMMRKVVHLPMNGAQETTTSRAPSTSVHHSQPPQPPGQRSLGMLRNESAIAANHQRTLSYSNQAPLSMSHQPSHQPQEQTWSQPPYFQNYTYPGPVPFYPVTQSSYQTTTPPTHGTNVLPHDQRYQSVMSQNSQTSTPSFSNSVTMPQWQPIQQQRPPTNAFVSQLQPLQQVHPLSMSSYNQDSSSQRDVPPLHSLPTSSLIQNIGMPGSSLQSIPQWTTSSNMGPSNFPPTSFTVPTAQPQPHLQQALSDQQQKDFAALSSNLPPHTSDSPVSPSGTCHPQNMLVDIAQTCQENFPFALIAERHKKPLQKVFDAFSAVIQLPLLKSAVNGRRASPLGAERMKQFRVAKKAVNDIHEKQKKGVRGQKRV